MRRLFIVFALYTAEAISGAIAGSPCSVSGEAPETPKADEIRLDGVVVTIDRVRRSFGLEVNAFTLPSGRTAALKTSRSKLVIVNERTEWLNRDDVMQSFSFLNLQPNIKAIVVGPDAGSGKPITARRVTVWDLNLPAKKPASPPESVVREPSSQDVVPNHAVVPSATAALIAFTAMRQGAYAFDLWVCDVNGRGRVLQRAEEGMGQFFHWMPNGKEIYFANDILSNPAAFLSGNPGDPFTGQVETLNVVNVSEGTKRKVRLPHWRVIVNIRVVAKWVICNRRIHARNYVRHSRHCR